VNWEALTGFIMALVALAAAVERALKARREELRAEHEAADRKRAEAQRDVVVEGVHRAGDPAVKAAIKRTALERGVESGLNDLVTKRYHPDRVRALDAPPPPAA
jgi:LPS O-antigen subunit length determinant protein (WzzB/FepE family)